MSAQNPWSTVHFCYILSVSKITYPLGSLGNNKETQLKLNYAKFKINRQQNIMNTDIYLKIERKKKDIRMKLTTAIH